MKLKMVISVLALSTLTGVLLSACGQGNVSTPVVESPVSTSPLPSTPIMEATLVLPGDTPQPTIEATMTGKDGMVLVLIPEGVFTMGGRPEDAMAECLKFGTDCQLDSFAPETPQHQVELKAFWIDQTEVTNAMYAQCVNEKKCSSPNDFSSSLRSSYYGNPEFDDYPVIYVNWEMANAYCSWAGRRLPSEAEWEKAARGTDGRMYPWGNDEPNDKLLNYSNNVGDTTQVGAYPAGASIYGALDMSGNVWEWVNDWYGEDYYQNSPSSNPLGPDFGEYRVLRGISYYYDDGSVHAALRSWSTPAGAADNMGFRCALDA